MVPRSGFQPLLVGDGPEFRITFFHGARPSPKGPCTQTVDTLGLKAIPIWVPWEPKSLLFWVHGPLGLHSDSPAAIPLCVLQRQALESWLLFSGAGDAWPS